MFDRIPLTVAALGALLLLGGCMREYTDPPARARTIVQPVTASQEPAPPAPVPMPEPSFPLPPQKPVPGMDTASLPPPLDADDPKRLVGLNEAQTIALLGDPFIVEERPPARIWTYATGGCRLQVFFYPDLSDQQFASLTVSFSGIEDAEAARRNCFATLLEKHGA